MKKLTLVLSLVLAMVFTMTGCSTNATSTEPAQETETTYSYEGSLKITGVEDEFEVPYNDIFNTFEAVTQNVHSISSSGEESDDEVTGVLLDTILADHGISQKDFNAIRLIAGDGYEITVPAEIIAEHDIILAYEFNGEGLEENKQPIRAAIDDVRSMYFVSNLVEISFSDAPVAEEVVVKDIVLLDTAVLTLEAEDYVYYESTDLAVTTADLLNSVGSESDKDLSFVASDGYAKTETMDVFSSGYIKFTGEDAPMFLSPDLQKGMYIKYIMKAETGDKIFASVASAMEGLGTTEVNGKTGVPILDFIDMTEVKADSYIFTATDGYSIELTGKDCKSGVLYIHDETGTVGLKFPEDAPKNWGLKDVLTITPVGGDAEETADTGSEATTAEWSIKFVGLEDGSFDFTSDRASSKMTLVELHTEKEKNDEVFPEDWTGYSIVEILDWLHVDSYSSLTIVASDGYEVEIPASEINDESIIAITKNGEPLADDVVVQFVQNTQFATTWVKGVSKVVVNP